MTVIWVLVDGEKIDEFRSPFRLSDIAIEGMERRYYDLEGVPVKMCRALTHERWFI